MNPTPDQIRSRQTAYLATEAWWKTRVEEIARKLRVSSDIAFTLQADLMHPEDQARAGGRGFAYDFAAKELEALLAERPSR